MYRYVNKFTEGLRNFTYDDVDLTKMGMTTDERKAAIRREKTGEEYQDSSEEEVDMFHCRLCDKDLKHIQKAIDMHVATRGHRRKFQAYKKRYAKFIRLARRRVLKAKRPRNLHYRRLIYYNMLINYE